MQEATEVRAKSSLIVALMRCCSPPRPPLCPVWVSLTGQAVGTAHGEAANVQEYLGTFFCSCGSGFIWGL